MSLDGVHWGDSVPNRAMRLLRTNPIGQVRTVQLELEVAEIIIIPVM